MVISCRVDFLLPASCFLLPASLRLCVVLIHHGQQMSLYSLFLSHCWLMIIVTYSHLLSLFPHPHKSILRQTLQDYIFYFLFCVYVKAVCHSGACDIIGSFGGEQHRLNSYNFHAASFQSCLFPLHNSPLAKTSVGIKPT